MTLRPMAKVAWTTPNRDICGPAACSHGAARLGTRQKVRWDDDFLYVAAFLVRSSGVPLPPAAVDGCPWGLE